MIKGHVKIDIHNHNSGFTERIEKDNMITNALNKIVPDWMGSNQAPNNGIMPLATRALGGLMLFDNDLTEDADNVFFPNEAHLVAFAGQETNADNPRYGSKNASESHETSTGYESVWDFGTSQANGSIKSLALTLRPGGSLRNNPFTGYWDGYTLHSIRRLNGDRSGWPSPLVYDEENQEMYFIGEEGYSSSSVYDSNRRIYTYTFNMTIYKEYLPHNKWKVNDEADRADYPEVVSQISYSIDSQSSDPRPYIMNGYDGYAYIVYADQNTSGDGSFTYYKLKLSDYSFELSEPVTVTVSSVSLYGGMNGAIINNGKCILKGYNRRWIYIVDLENPVIVRSVDLGEGYWCMDNAFTNFRNGVVKFTMVSNGASESRYYWYDALLYTDGWVVANAPYREDTSSYDYYNSPHMLITDTLMVYGNKATRRAYGYMLANYLATICNLSSAIVKTAASSMKVTYTLTNVEEGDG